MIAALFFTGALEAKNEAMNNWQLTKQSEGIIIYVSESPRSALKVFRGVVTIPARLGSLVAVLDDVNVFPKLIHDCKSAKVLKKVIGKESTIYLVTKMPWPVKNRDSIIHSVLTQDKKSKRVLIRMNGKPKAVPFKKGMVRVQHMSGYWDLMPLKNGNTQVTYEMSIDPSGNLPKWLVNTLAVDFPYNTLKNLRNLVKLPAYMNVKNSYIID
jgi:hypothetical protein